MLAPRLFDPDAEPLFREIAILVDDSMLRDIAEADHGAWSAENYAILCRMRDVHFVPCADWVPKEVLELVRWSEPDDPGWRPGGQGRRGHLMRAFCCASLLRMAGTRDIDAYLSFNETIAGLLESLDALDIGLWSQAGSLLMWFLDRSASADRHEEDAFLGVALLLCGIRIAKPDDASLENLSVWIWESESRVVVDGVREPAEENWLHRISAHDMRRQTWQALARKWIEIDPKERASQLGYRVRSTLEALAGNRGSSYPA